MFVLGIDIGTTNIKAGIYDESGQEMTYASISNGKTFQHIHGYFELDMANLWELTKELILKITNDFKHSDQIVSVGVCGHGNGLYLLNSDCRPVRNGISSLDSRAQFMVERIGDLPEASLAKVYCHTPLAYIKWLKVYDNDTYKQSRWIIYSKDWINYNLTGVLATDVTNTSSSGLTHNHSKTIDEKLFKTFELQECYDMIPPILDPTDILGHISSKIAQETGLPIGTPVISGAHDVSASSLGAGGVYHGHLTSIIGTWNINYLVLNDDNVEDMSAHLLPGMRSMYFGDVNSGNCLDWYINLFYEDKLKTTSDQDGSVYEIIDKELAYEPPTDIMFSPHLYPSVDNSASSSGFTGIHNWHTKPQIIKSIYEGLAHSYYTQIKKMVAYADIPSIYLTGGGAISKIWPQIFADMTNKPVKVLSDVNTSCKGVAIASLLGINAKTDIHLFTNYTFHDYTYQTNQAAHKFYLSKYKGVGDG